MKYLIMIHSNPGFARLWEELTDEQRTGLGSGHLALSEELTASGELIASEGLAGPEQSTLVTVRDGRTIRTDGPLAEAKEHLAGFYLVDVPSVERAVEIAAKVPDATWSAVEVRPVLDVAALMG
ncbi:MAG TPA: YciI family protein [Mycobacteriales bacterium]|jgi:hypothetical protein|nr:YciI family protein [Mycobacteriales bacterium]